MKDLGFKLLYLVAAAIVVFNVVFEVYNSLFFNIKDLPDGQFVSSETLPDGKILNFYLLKNNIGCAVRGELVTVKYGSATKRNIFWQTDIENADVSWKAPATVVINGVEIDLSKGEFYDCRRGTSLFQDGALEGEAADKVQQEGKK